MFQKINIPKKNIVLKDDYYINLLKLKLQEQKKINDKTNLKIKLIYFINSWS